MEDNGRFSGERSGRRDQGRRNGSRIDDRDAMAGLTFALLKARETVIRRFRPVFHRQNITEQQSRVLRALASHKAAEITELAELTCLLPPSISRILRDLESRGLVQREISPLDLRRNVITLTAAGQKLVDASAAEITHIFQNIIDEFGNERLGNLYSLLIELETALGQHGEGLEASEVEDA